MLQDGDVRRPSDSRLSPQALYDILCGDWAVELGRPSDSCLDLRWGTTIVGFRIGKPHSFRGGCDDEAPDPHRAEHRLLFKVGYSELWQSPRLAGRSSFHGTSQRALSRGETALENPQP